MPERFQYLISLDAHHLEHDRRYVRGSFAAAELQTVQLVITEDEFSNSRSPSIATKFDPMTSTAKRAVKVSGQPVSSKSQKGPIRPTVWQHTFHWPRNDPRTRAKKR
jgi:hypothetical protein